MREAIEAIKAGLEHCTLELHSRGPDGALRTLSAEGAAVRDESGAVVKISGTVQDITDIRAAEAARRALERQLHHAQKLEALGTLAGGIAHDLNNTLQPILALSQLALDRHPEGGEDREDLELIHGASVRARDLVRQIVAFSRKQTIERKSIDAASIVREALRLLRVTLPATITVVEEIADVPPLFGDSGQINQVIVNLVTNAAQAIGEGNGTIGVSLALDRASSPTDAQTVRIAVRDSGCGMDQATMERIFEPFFTTKKVGEGTGLGLSVVHGIVKSHGGTVEVESRPGAGTCVTVHLPVRGDRKERAPSERRKSA